LKSINLRSDDLKVAYPDKLVADLFRQLSFALEVEEIVLDLKLVVPGSLLRDIGERCTKLKKLNFSNEIVGIDGPFDSPTAFPALESLCFDTRFLGKMADEERNAIEPPDFSHFWRLTSVENVLWNAKWALSLANAPCLKSIDDGWHDGNSWMHLTKEELRAFFKACQGPIRTSLTSISLNDRNSSPLPMDEVTAIALLDAFPMLEELVFWIRFSFSEPFLNKLKKANHIKHLDLDSVQGVRPTRAWLAEWCPRFPKTLEGLQFEFYDFEPDEDDLQGGSKEEYIEFIKATFRSCLPKLTWLEIKIQ